MTSICRRIRWLSWNPFHASRVSRSPSNLRRFFALSSGGLGLASLYSLTCRSPLLLDSDGPSASTNSNSDGRSYIPYSEVQKHTHRDSCWVIIEGLVYDATSILDTHPGGSGVLLRNSGKDATKAFKPIHPPDTLLSLPKEAILGPVDSATLPREVQEESEEEKRIAQARRELPPPDAVLNLREIAKLAEKVLTAKAWGYYRSASDDERTFDENIAAYERFWFRPRVLNKISGASARCRIFGFPSSLPIFVSPAALARLGHPDGEMNIARAAASEGILMGLSSNASCSRKEIMSVRVPGQNLIFQLYMNRDRAASEILIKGLEKEGWDAIMLTVDAAVAGKRERDRRASADTGGSSPNRPPPTSGGVALAISGYQDPDVCWDDIPWIQSLTKLPLIIKGIQCTEDAVKAFEYGVQAIILSNHGGRELDFAPPAIILLHELRQERPDIIYKHEVYIDGGVTRGTDVLKALCLGARGVGLGRAFLYGNAVWGEEGVRKVIQILREEIETSMRLLGVTSLAQLNPKFIRYSEKSLTSRL